MIYIYIYDIGLHLFRPECLQGAELYVVLKVPLAPCWERTILSKKKCPPQAGVGGAVQLEDIWCGHAQMETYVKHVMNTYMTSVWPFSDQSAFKVLNCTWCSKCLWHHVGSAPSFQRKNVHPNLHVAQSWNASWFTVENIKGAGPGCQLCGWHKSLENTQLKQCKAY